MPLRRPRLRQALLPAALTGALAACGPAARPPQTEAPAEGPATAAAAGYLAPPEIVAAVRQDGQVLLRGRAPAAAEVTLAAPDGFAHAMPAGADGSWSVSVPVPQAPRLFALSAKTRDRVLRAQGAVVVLPGTGPAALLARAGYAALPLGPAGQGLRIVALDYDVGGGAAIAGFAAPRARVSVAIDGEAAGIGQADSDGRFAVMASNQSLTPGERRIEVVADGARASVSTLVSAPGALSGQPYRVARQPGGWRVDWTPAGGGVQTTVVFDPAEAPA